MKLQTLQVRRLKEVADGFINSINNLPLLRTSGDQNVSGGLSIGDGLVIDGRFSILGDTLTFNWPSGNLGINNTNPVHRTHLVQNGDYGVLLETDGTGTTAIHIGEEATILASGVEDQAGVFQNNSGDSILFRINGEDVLNITADSVHVMTEVETRVKHRMKEVFSEISAASGILDSVPRDGFQSANYNLTLRSEDDSFAEQVRVVWPDRGARPIIGRLGNNPEPDIEFDLLEADGYVHVVLVNQSFKRWKISGVAELFIANLSYSSQSSSHSSSISSRSSEVSSSSSSSKSSSSSSRSISSRSSGSSSSVSSSSSSRSSASSVSSSPSSSSATCWFLSSSNSSSSSKSSSSSSRSSVSSSSVSSSSSFGGLCLVASNFSDVPNGLYVFNGMVNGEFSWINGVTTIEWNGFAWVLGGIHFNNSSDGDYPTPDNWDTVGSFERTDAVSCNWSSSVSSSWSSLSSSSQSSLSSSSSPSSRSSSSSSRSSGA